MKLNCMALIVIFSLICCTACDSPSAKTARVGGVVNTKLANLPADVEPGEIVFSPDGKEVAVAYAKDGLSLLSRNGSSVASFQGVRDLMYGKSKSSFVFIAKVDGRECVVTNGVKGRLFDSIGKLLVTSGGRILYAARSGDKWVIVSGTKESLPFNSNNVNLIVSESASRFVYTELDKDNIKSHLRICSIDLDSCSNGSDYDAVSAMLMDPTGSRLSFLASKNSKTALMTVDMKNQGVVESAGAWHDEITVYDLSEGGHNTAYLARNGKQQLLVKNGKSQLVSRVPISLQMSVSNSGRAIYIGVEGNDVLLFLDGQQVGDRFKGIDSISFSQDGSHYAFIANYQDHDRLFVDGVGRDQFDKIVDARFSPDGKSIMYRARQNGRRFMVVADANGNNAKQHQHYDGVWGGVFLADGKSVGYGVKIGSELWWKVEKL